jgi:hypothetical protein
MTADAVYDPGAAAPRHYDFNADQQATTSTLDDLRLAVQQAAEVAEEEFADHELFSPGGHIRLTCSTELSQADWKRIQFSAIPQAYRGGRRRGGIPDIRKMDEAVAYAALIGEQTVAVAIRQGDGTYKTVEHNGEDGPFSDPALLAKLGAAEPAVAVRNIFVKDAYLLHAGQELQNACGYGERRPGDPGEDDSDPT